LEIQYLLKTVHEVIYPPKTASYSYAGICYIIHTFILLVNCSCDTLSVH
jgi:hypothetical protein